MTDATEKHVLVTEITEQLRTITPETIIILMETITKLSKVLEATGELRELPETNPLDVS